MCVGGGEGGGVDERREAALTTTTTRRGLAEEQGPNTARKVQRAGRGQAADPKAHDQIKHASGIWVPYLGWAVRASAKATVSREAGSEKQTRQLPLI